MTQTMLSETGIQGSTLSNYPFIWGDTMTSKHFILIMMTQVNVQNDLNITAQIRVLPRIAGMVTFSITFG
jgi:hypothetical protein